MSMNNGTILSNKELRAAAIEQWSGGWVKILAAVIIASLVNSLTSLHSSWAALHRWSVVPFAPPKFSLTWLIFQTILTIMVSGAIYLGTVGFSLKIARGKDVTVKNIFDGFKRFLSASLLMFFMYLFIILWCFLLIIPGIIKSLSYSMAFYIMHDNPEIKTLDAITKSRAMMKGNKRRLCLLILGFPFVTKSGLLCLAFSIVSVFVVVNFYAAISIMVLILGVLFYIMGTQIMLTIANFYNNLKENQMAPVINTES